VPGREILVHRCSGARENDGKPLRCGCSGRVSVRDAERMVRLGRARKKQELRSDGSLIDLDDEIVIVGREWRPARTISAADITAAYVDGDESARRHIAEYGALKSEVRNENRRSSQ
jgi:hypothetical protein